jgi:hypothetical protein
MLTVGEGVVEAILWYATDPLGEPPAAIAEMEEPYRSRALAALRLMVDRHGGAGAVEIAAGVAEHIHESA